MGIIVPDGTPKQDDEGKRSDENAQKPTCRSCYAATLTRTERERFYAEPVTTSIYLCDDHQAAMDRLISSLPQVQIIQAIQSPFPGFTPVEEDESS